MTSSGPCSNFGLGALTPFDARLSKADPVDLRNRELTLETSSHKEPDYFFLPNKGFFLISVEKL